MTRAEAVRLCAALAQCEMALVRRDPVAPALLAQAARHAAGLPPADDVAAAARLARTAAGLDPGPPADAARKAAQALCRAAVIAVDEALLGPGAA
jgi:hypothetical protein